jgi:hypothetical protein
MALFLPSRLWCGFRPVVANVGDDEFFEFVGVDHRRGAQFEAGEMAFVDEFLEKCHADWLLNPSSYNFGPACP